MAEQARSPDFKYIVRLVNTDLDGKNQVAVGLARIKGIGNRVASLVADAAGVPRRDKLGDLSDEQVQKLSEALEGVADIVPPWFVNRAKDFETGEDLHLLGPEVDLRRRDDLNRLKKIQSYRGVRHLGGQKVRGQRTRSNGRTGLTVGVQRKAIQQAAAAGAKEEGKGRKEKEEKPKAGGAAAPAKAGAAPAKGAAKPAEKAAEKKK